MTCPHDHPLQGVYGEDTRYVTLSDMLEWYSDNVDDIRHHPLYPDWRKALRNLDLPRLWAIKHQFVNSVATQE